jgi:hypothetical protein
MSRDINIRWGWLKGIYIYTIVGAGVFGLGMIVIPEVIKSMFRWPVEEPIAFGIVGSVYVTFRLLSILGLRSPLKFVPLLLLQLCYKSIWFIGVFLPLLVTAQFPDYAILFIIIFATYIIGDLIALPFSYVFAKESNQ